MFYVICLLGAILYILLGIFMCADVVIHFREVEKNPSTAISSDDIASLSETEKQIVEEYIKNTHKPITYGEFKDLVMHQKQVESLNFHDTSTSI